MNELLFTAGAEQDYTAALRWYAAQSDQAAEGFQAEFERALEAVAANPDQYPSCDERHKFFLMKRYPFQMIYRAVDDTVLLIVAVAHTSRRPGFWSNR